MSCDGLDHAADLMIGVRKIGGINFDLPDEQLLFVGGELSQSFNKSFGQGVILASCGITPSRFWLAKIVSRSLFQPSSNRCMS